MTRISFLSVCLLAFSIVFSPFLSSTALAETDPQNTENPDPQSPIEMKMEPGFLGILGGGMNYSIEGKKLNGLNEFQKIIDPLRDPEASKLIHEAEEAEFAWLILAVGGVASGIDIALFYKPVPFINIDFIDRIASGAVALQIFLAPGIIMNTIATSDKFNAVQRYNHLVRQEETAGLKISPQLFACQDHLGLGLKCAF